jgi:Na+-driven multidrug efflux pump
MLFSTAIHIPITYYFVVTLNLGMMGAGMAITISMTFCLFLLYLYAYSIDELYPFIEFEIVSSFTNWGGYFSRVCQIGIALVIETMY